MDEIRKLKANEIYSFKIEPVLNSFYEIGLLVMFVFNTGTHKRFNITDPVNNEKLTNEIRDLFNKDKNFYEFKLLKNHILAITRIFIRKEKIIGKWKSSITVLVDELGRKYFSAKIIVGWDLLEGHCETVYESFYPFKEQATKFIDDLLQYEFDKF